MIKNGSKVVDEASENRMVFITDAHHERFLDVIGYAVTGKPEPVGLRPPDPPEHWVYFIQAGTGGPIKIGYSTDPKHRFVTLQTGSPTRHHYLGNIPGSRRTEQEIHARFRAAHLRGEWYDPMPELLEYIEENRFRSDSTWDPADQPAKLW